MILLISALKLSHPFLGPCRTSKVLMNGPKNAKEPHMLNCKSRYFSAGGAFKSRVSLG
jgi:hypothetical protein